MLTVITGPPCAGKTTYARQHALPGDIIIDFDEIAMALGCPARHAYGDKDHIWHVTLAARNAAITTAIQRHHHGARVWVIDCVIPGNRQAAYAANGARIVTLHADPAELHRRADEGRPASWHGQIDQWLATGGKPVQGPRDPVPRRGTAW
jgi:hypothetical protein